MAEPSLSELYSYRPNPDLATGDRDIVPDNAGAIRDAIGLAQSYSDGIAKRYALFQKAFADRLKAGTIDYSGVNPVHIPELQKLAKDYFVTLSKNPAAIVGINANPQAVAELAEKEDTLNRSIAQSKKQYEYANFQDLTTRHVPELLTDNNKKKLQRFYNAPLGEFVPESLDLPSALDFGALAKAISPRAQVERSVFEPEYVAARNENGELIPLIENGKVILGEDGSPKYKQEYAAKYKSGILKETDFNTFMKLGAAAYDTNSPAGKFNIPIQTSVRETFNGLDERQKINIESAAKSVGMDPLRYFYLKGVESEYAKQTDLSGVKEVEDTLYKQKQDFRNDLKKMKTKFGYDVYLKNLDLKNDKDFELWKDKNGLRDVDKGGEFLNDMTANAVGDAISKGWANARQLGSAAAYDKPREGGAGIKPAWHTMNISPSVKEFFSIEVPGEKKSDKPKKISPKEIWVNSDGTEVLPVFAGDESATGARSFDKGLTKPMTVDQFKETMARGFGLEKSLDASTRMLRRIEGMEFPTLNGTYELYIKNRSSGDYNPDKGGGGNTSVKKSQTGGGSMMQGQLNPESFTKAELKSAGWTDAQIKQAVSENKIKIKQ